MDAIVYSTETKTAKESLVRKTCTECKKNPLMSECSCDKELTDINSPACIIVYQALKRVFPTV